MSPAPELPEDPTTTTTPSRASSRRALVLAALAIALALPAALRSVVTDRLEERVQPALGRALGVPVSISSVEVTLTGTLRLDGVAVGSLFSADAVEASVGLSTLLRGAFSADEITVHRPRLSAHVLPDGELDIAALLRRVRDARRRAPTAAAAAAPRRVRRILVSGGELVLAISSRGGPSPLGDLADLGELRARGVELHPQEGGVRAIAAAVDLRLRRGDDELVAHFGATAADLVLPALAPRRAAAERGRVELRLRGGEPLVLDDAIVTHGVHGPRETRLDARDAEGRLGLRLVRGDDGAISFALDVTRLRLAALGPLLAPAVDVTAATIAGRVFLRRPASGPAALEIDARLEGLRWADELLAVVPVPIDGAIRGELELAPDRVAGHLRLSRGALDLDLDGAVGLGGRRLTTVAVTATLPPLACADALAALPAPFASSLEGLELSGRLGGRARLVLDRARPDDLTLDVGLEVGCRVERDVPGASPADLERPGAALVLPGGERRGLAGDDPSFAALDDLPDHVSGAFVAAEDDRFWEHAGFDAEQIRRSFAVNVAAGRAVRGGSTISQQLVKNLYLSRERTLARKLAEAVLTWRLEQGLDKRRILEIYLNVVELGEGIHGVEPAARRWFGKPARQLTIGEAAFLAAITPAPVPASRRFAQGGALDEQTRERWAIVLGAMRRAGVITREEARAAATAGLRLLPASR